MKYVLYLIALVTFAACQGAGIADDGKIEKEDLAKLKWLEGNWTGDFRGQPFYNVFTLLNDSTLQYTTHLFVGTDSAHTNIHKMHWKDTTYFLGDGLNYRVVEMNEKGVKMIPHNQSVNDIMWNYVDHDTWKATLATPRDTLSYIMKRIESMEEILAAKPTGQDTIR
jgi:hypothetical protein